MDAGSLVFECPDASWSRGQRPLCHFEDPVEDPVEDPAQSDGRSLTERGAKRLVVSVAEPRGNLQWTVETDWRNKESASLRSQ